MLLSIFLYGARTDVSRFNLFGGTYDADWLFLRAYLNPVIETHDGLFEDIEERLLPDSMKRMYFRDVRKKITTFQA